MVMAADERDGSNAASVANVPRERLEDMAAAMRKALPRCEGEAF
jgi:hypothetical protein